MTPAPFLREKVSDATAVQMVSVICIVLIWHSVAAWILGGDSLLVPTPAHIVGVTVGILGQPTFIGHIARTMGRAVMGTGLAVGIGVPLGILMGWSNDANELLTPQLSALYPLPVIAVLPLLVLLTHDTEIAIVLAAAFGGVFLVVWNAMAGVKHVTATYVDAARDNGVTSTAVLFTEVLFPGAVPTIIVGVRLCLYITLLITISAEMLFGSNGLGYVLWVAYQTYTLQKVYATVIVIGLLGIGVTYGLTIVTNRLLAWHPNGELDSRRIRR